MFKSMEQFKPNPEISFGSLQPVGVMPLFLDQKGLRRLVPECLSFVFGVHCYVGIVTLGIH